MAEVAASVTRRVDRAYIAKLAWAQGSRLQDLWAKVEMQHTHLKLLLQYIHIPLPFVWMSILLPDVEYRGSKI